MRLLLAFILSGLLTACTSLFFQPQSKEYMTPDAIGLAYQDVYFPGAEGQMLHAWWLPAKDKAAGTVLFLHGNAENITTHIASVYWLPAQHYNVLLLDYRGYGRSQGEPSIVGALEDINSAMKHLLQRADVDPERIVMLGQSLGGALSIYYVAHSPYRHNIKALIVESSFASYRDISREKLASFWLTWPLQWPLSFTIDDSYSPLYVVEQVSPIPLLVIHGDKDRVAPLHHGQELFDAAQQPKEFWVVPGGGHIDAFRRKGYQERLVQYLQQVLERAAGTGPSKQP